MSETKINQDIWLWVVGENYLHSRNSSILAMTRKHDLMSKIKTVFQEELLEQSNGLRVCHRDEGQSYIKIDFWPNADQTMVLTLAEKIANILKVELHLEQPSSEWLTIHFPMR